MAERLRLFGRAPVVQATAAVFAPAPVAARGFLRTVDAATLARIQASPWVSGDFETTALSPSSPPTRLGSGQKIGGEYTATAYQRIFGAGIDCRPRARVWSLLLATGERLAFDLDGLTHEEVRSLLMASMHQKTVIGHNLGFDLGWALAYAPDLQPALVIDVMLLVRCLRPGAPWRVHELAAQGHDAAMALVAKRKGDASASLNALCIAYGLEVLNKDYQKPHNWCVKRLSAGHFDYVMGDIDAPPEILRRMTGVPTVERALEMLYAQDMDLYQGVYHQLYARAPLALAQMSRRGLPLHVPTLQRIRADRTARVERLVPALIQHMPDMATHDAALRAGKAGVAREVKDVLAAYAAANGCELDMSEDDVPIIQRKKAALKGATQLDGWKVWDELQRCKKVLSLCAEYEDFSLPTADPEYRRLHPLIGAVTVTLRCSSQAPNSQNLLRPDQNPLDGAETLEIEHIGDVIKANGHDLTAAVYLDAEQTPAGYSARFDELQFRSVVRAPDGHKLVSVDQSQVELRIAAALAQRAIAEARSALAGEMMAPAWVLQALRRGDDDGIVLDETVEGFDGFRDQLAAAWRRVRVHGAPLAEVFRRGLDPHLLTGIGIAAREGAIDLGGLSPVEYLSHPDTDTKALKSKLKTYRQSAKPANFGLLYGAMAETLWRLGVTDYGLDWSLEEATAVRAAWLEQYADVRFWQLWVQLVHCTGKHDLKPLYRSDRHTKELETKEYKIRTSRTLGGRPIYTPQLREVLNHQDQSTGAEITTRAIVDMPEPARSYLVNAVHDELLAVCPEGEAKLVADQIRGAMIVAMDRVLSPWGIPSDADAGIHGYWTKD